MIISTKTYRIARQILTLLVPAIVAAVTGAGAVYGFNTEIISGTIGIVATLAGVVLQVLATNYDKALPDENTNEDAE